MKGWYSADRLKPLYGRGRVRKLCDRIDSFERMLARMRDERDDARAEGTRWAESATKARAQVKALEPIVRHVAGLVAPEAGAEYGEVHRELIYHARRVLGDDRQ